MPVKCQPFFLLLIYLACAIQYPISFTTIRGFSLRRTPEDLAQLMTIPGYRPNNFSQSYKYISLDGWTFNKGYQQSCELWANADKYFGKLTRFGTNASDIQTYIKNLYNKEGIGLLVTVFSSYEFPVSENIDAKQAADKVALFITANNLDGAVLQFEDVSQLVAENSTAPASNWILNFLAALRQNLPNDIIVIHLYASDLQSAYQLPQYINQINLYVDFYVIKYYDVAGNDYGTTSAIFTQSVQYIGTSVQQLMALGIRGNMLVVGKPSTINDTWNPQSYVDATVLSDGMKALYTNSGWYSGYANNDLANDLTGVYNQATLTALTNLCDDSALCM